MIGTRLGPYEILAELGSGGVATVYRAHQASVDRHVALKVIHRSFSPDTEALQRFRREARLIARLEHPHILPLYDFDPTHDPPYIVMRCLDGGTLRDLMLRRRLSAVETCSLLQQVAAALDYAHRQGIVHRDVKPSNILLDRDGNAFVSDFGIARLALEERFDGGLKTPTSIPLGTPEYMPPEQALGHGLVDHRADVYSLAILAYQLLVGQLPFTADSPVGVIVQQVQAPAPSAHAANPDLPLELDGVLGRGLAKNPADRFQTAGELVAAIRTVLLGGGPGLAPVTPSEIERPLPSERIPGRTPTQLAEGEQYKVVTALYADASDFARAIEEADSAEVAHSMTQELWRRTFAIVEAYGGKVIATGETHALALWGTEMAREDDPERSVFAGLKTRKALHELWSRCSLGHREALPIRIGINTGSALLSPRPGNVGAALPTPLTPHLRPITASGAAISLAELLAEHAVGSILISQDTFQNVLGVFHMEAVKPLPVRGGKELLKVYRVIAAKERAFRVRTRGVDGIKTRLVGRDAELQYLQEAYLSSAEDHDTTVITLSGDAGVGKSRLVEEFTTWAAMRPEKVVVLRARAASDSTNRPYALLRDLLVQSFKILDTDTAARVREKLQVAVATLLPDAPPEQADFLGQLAGFDLSASPFLAGMRSDPQQLTRLARQAWTRFLTTLASRQSVVITLEDFHWCDEPSLSLLADLLREHRDLALLVIAIARSLIYERDPAWGSERGIHRRLDLQPLTKRESRALLREVLQKMRDVPRELSDLVVERAEGNPYFIEELVKTLIEDRVIQRSESTWTADISRLASLPVPPTLVGLLQGRVDSLLAPERVILQRASVVGRRFWAGAIATLERADGVAFNDIEAPLHSLTQQEFIYPRDSSDLAGDREYLFAQSMLRDVAYQTLTRRQLRAYHAGIAEWLAKATRDRLGEFTAMIAEHLEKAGENEQAIAFLTQAGDRAAQVSAFNQALAFYQRAMALLGSEPGERSTQSLALLRLKSGTVLREAGDCNRSTPEIEAALNLARRAGDRQLIAEALYQLGLVASLAGDYPRAQSLLAESLPVARSLGSTDAGRRTLAWVLYGLGDLAWRLGNPESAVSTLEESLSLARSLDDLALTLYALNRLGGVRVIQGRLDEGRELLQQGLELADDAGNRERLGTFLNNLGEIHRREGNLDTAVALYLKALGIDREIGNSSGEAVRLANLGMATMYQGSLDEAAGYLREALRLSLAMGMLPMAMATLIHFSHMRFEKGDVDGAMSLLGLALAHPATHADVRQDAEPVLRRLRAMLAPADLEAGLARGRSRELASVVDELLTL